MRRRRPVLTLALAGSLSGALTPAAALAGATASIEVRVGRAEGFTRIEFRGAQPLAVRRDGQTLVLRFGAVAPMNLSELHVAPPKGLESAERAVVGGGEEIRLKLSEGANATIGRADGAAFVNLVPPLSKPEAGASVGQAAGAVVRIGAALRGRSLQLSFPWAKPTAAAVFRRGEAVWVVFAAPARFDLGETPHGLPQLTRIEPVQDEHVAALRLVVPPGVRVGMNAEGATWTLLLGPDAAPPAGRVEIKRADGGGLSAALAGGASVAWIKDPAVGDRLAVVPAFAPAKGVAAEARFVEATLLASAQGLALEPRADGLTVSADGDTVRIGGQRALSAAANLPPAPSSAGDNTIDLPRAGPMPGLVMSDAWGRTGKAGFLARYDALRSAAADEGALGAGASVDARLGLARFLLGAELAHEAIGVLNLLAKTNPEVVDTAAFRGLRGAARAMAGRARDAEADLSAPAVAGDAACAVWRAWLLVQGGDPAGARERFAEGRAAIDAFSPAWRARFHRAEAEAALAAGDAAGARAALGAIPAAALPQADAQLIALSRAKLAEADHRPDEALRLYTPLENSDYGAVSASATLRAVQLRLGAGVLPLTEAFRELDGLRFRWRGDATELRIIRELGDLYLVRGRYREALETLRSVGRKLSDSPASVALQAELNQAFGALFLDGGADGLEPLQALALFDDFRELTPVGADGDLMVRKLAKRLVQVDLLDQAANLLQYQVDNRLDGVPKAEVSADLAAIYLAARKPEQAMAAIEGSRSTLLPTALNAGRRRLEARALVALGRYDHALELLASDTSAEAQAVRAEAAWGRQSWAEAAAAFEAALGDRWKASAEPLGAEDRDRLLRAAVAYSLAKSDRDLARLRERWSGLAGTGRDGDALRLALAGEGDAPLRAADLAKTGPDLDALGRWIAAAKAPPANDAGPERART